MGTKRESILSGLYPATCGLTAMLVGCAFLVVATCGASSAMTEVGDTSPSSAGEYSWSRYFGGSDVDCANAIAVDSWGNTYLAGHSNRTWGSPLRPYTGGFDAFVAKIDANGSLIWNTFIGGAGDDRAYGIAADEKGDVYVVGEVTNSFGMTGVDGFVFKYDANGTLDWDMVLGGLGSDSVSGVVSDGRGSVFLVGTSENAWDWTALGVPLIRPYTGDSDVFVIKMNETTGALWTTFLGGSAYDVGEGISVDAEGSVRVAGLSLGGWGSPVRPYTATDGFVARLDANGYLLWNTFLGGADYETCRGVSVDRTGNAYVVGSAGGPWGNPVRPFAGRFDVFAARLGGDGSLQWNAFLGSSGLDIGAGINVDGGGNAYVTGISDSSWGVPTRAFTDSYDAIAAKLDSNGSLLWNTFLGGWGEDAGYGIAAGTDGSVFVAGGCTSMWGGSVIPPETNHAFMAKLVQPQSGPTITQIKSKRATRGSAATVMGSGFSAKKTDNVVYFGNLKAEIKRARTTRLQVKIPMKCKKGQVMVYAVVKGVNSNSVPFTVK
ncbi:MAG: SBBP repeat-containing protein [Acidobacteriota bacterium]